jgi:hypothetical protein
MIRLLNLFMGQDVVGTIGRTIAAVDTQVGLITLTIPEDRPKGAGLDTISAPDTSFGSKVHAATGSLQQSIGGTNPGTRRVGTGATYNHDETSTNATCGAYVYARTFQASLARPAGAGKHARLATDTVIDIYDR